VYWFAAAGTANEDYKISYTGTGGVQETLTLPGIVPGWRQEVHVDPGAFILSLQVSARSSDFNFKIRCQIEIDGFIEESEQVGSICALQVRFPRKSGPRSPAPPPPTTAGSAPPLPASCRPVDRAEAMQIVLETANVLKTVLSASENNGTCTYFFDANAGSIGFSWTPGKQGPPPLGSTQVPGVDGPVYWVGYGDRQGILEAHLPKGVFRVEALFLGLNIDAKAAAVKFFETARPRLG
jgi:hypothetical protein